MPATRKAVAVRAYGDSDDHFRLVVLLADAAAARQPRLTESEPYRICLSRESAWDARTEALWELLGEDMGTRGLPVAEIVDIDALDPGTKAAHELWDDRSFRRQRRALLGQVLTAVTSGRLAARRVLATSRRVTNALDESPVAVQGGEPVFGAARKVRDWLCQEGHLSPEDIGRFASAMADTELESCWVKGCRDPGVWTHGCEHAVSASDGETVRFTRTARLVREVLVAAGHERRLPIRPLASLGS